MAYQGLDGGIASVNGMEPDETGNVTLTPVDVGAAEPEEVQNLFRKASPINLLDNSDFANPVAQAGIGGNHGNQAYAIDRWILTSGSVSQQVGVGLTLNGTITQKLEHPPAGAVSAFVGMASGSANISYSGGTVTISSAGGVIAWAALYEGSYNEQTKPEYHPKGYSTELEECLRYYQTSENNQIFLTSFASDLGFYDAIYPFFVPMRITPTILVKSANGQSGMVTLGYANYSWTDVSYGQRLTTNQTLSVRGQISSPYVSVALYFTYEAIADL